MRLRDFWRSAAGDSIVGFRLVAGMCIFWLGPLLLIAIGLMTQPQRWAMVWWSVVALVGWVLAWAVMLVRHAASAPGARADLTPTGPMVLPAVLMVGGVAGALLAF